MARPGHTDKHPATGNAPPPRQQISLSVPRCDLPSRRPHGFLPSAGLLPAVLQPRTRAPAPGPLPLGLGCSRAAPGADGAQSRPWVCVRGHTPPPEARPQPALRAAPVPRQAARAAPLPRLRPSRGHSRGVGAAQGFDLPLLLLLEAGAGGQRRGGRAGAAALGEGEQPVHPPAAAPGGRGAPAAPHPGLAPSRMRAAAPPPPAPRPSGGAPPPRRHAASSPPRARDACRGRAEEGVARPADRRRGGANAGRPGRRLAPPPSVRGEGGKAAARGDDVMALCGGGSASCVSCGDWRFWGVGAAAGPRQTRRGPARPGPPGGVSERPSEGRGRGGQPDGGREPRASPLGLAVRRSGPRQPLGGPATLTAILTAAGGGRSFRGLRGCRRRRARARPALRRPGRGVTAAAPSRSHPPRGAARRAGSAASWAASRAWYG